MANLPINESPQFSQTMEQITSQDRAAPDTFNPRYQTLLENDNYLNKAVERNQAVDHILIPAANWSAEAPYEQTVSVPGMTAADNPIIALHIPEGATREDVEAWKKAWGMVDKAIMADGQITYRCYIKKPVTDFTVTIKGV